MDALKIANKYFQLSNDSNFDGIAKMLTEQTTYNSQNTGQHTGRGAIIAMQKVFHSEFKAKQWEINNIKEIKPNLVLVDYTFYGEKTDGKKVETSGIEYIAIKNGKIVGIEIKNKD